MTGKIFTESSNIYEDQAKILFDYYKRAAEKIVEEAIDIENKIEQAINDKDTSLERQKKHKIISIVSVSIAGAAFIGAVVCFIVSNIGLGVLLGMGFLGSGIYSLINFLKMKKAKEDFDNFEQKIDSLNTDKEKIRRDYKVSKMGVAYVPVATRVPFEGKSFVVDHTGTVSNTDFSLSVLNKPKELQKSLQDLESNLNSIPVV